MKPSKPASPRRRKPVHRSRHYEPRRATPLFDRRGFETLDPSIEFFVPAPDSSSVPMTVRLDVTLRQHLESYIHNPRTRWSNLSEAVRWCVFQGCQQLAQLFADRNYGEHMRMLSAEYAARAVENKRVEVDRYIDLSRRQVRHCIELDEIHEATRIFEKAIDLFEATPRFDTLMWNRLRAYLADDEFALIRRAAGWEAPPSQKPKPS